MSLCLTYVPQKHDHVWKAQEKKVLITGKFAVANLKGKFNVYCCWNGYINY